MATPLETGIDWGTKLPDAEIHYRFAAGGGVYTTSLGPVNSFDFEPYEIAQFRFAFEVFERYLGVTFVEVSSGEEITLVSSNGDSMGEDTLGVAGPPGEPHQGIAAYNYEGLGWDYDSPGFGALEQGGYGFTTLIHEIGHLLGLAHPHDGGGTSTVFPGVTAEFGDYGDFDLNQGVFTMMSYNDGWQTSPSGTPVDGEVFGFEGTPMAIDIAVLQAKYGANLTFHAGNDTYSTCRTPTGSGPSTPASGMSAASIRSSTRGARLRRSISAPPRFRSSRAGADLSPMRREFSAAIRSREASSSRMPWAATVTTRSPATTPPTAFPASSATTT